MESNIAFVEFCRGRFLSFKDAREYFDNLSVIAKCDFKNKISTNGSFFEWQGLTLHENDMKSPHENEDDESINLNAEELHGGLTCFTKCVGDISVTYTFNSVEDLIKYEKSQN